MMARLLPALAAAALMVAMPVALADDGIDVGAGGSVTLHVRSIREAKFARTTRQQFDFSCGSAALATLLSHHYRRNVGEQAIFEYMYAHGDQATIRRQGFSLLDMQGYLASIGLRADGFTLPLEKLAEAKLPAIVLIVDQGYHHFVVIKGIAGGRVLLGDPSRGSLAMPLARFYALWSNRLLFVIHDYPGEVQFNLAADWAAAPPAPLADGIPRTGLDLVTLPKMGAGDF
jgi:predicted double-glycine peptidase